MNCKNWPQLTTARLRTRQAMTSHTTVTPANFETSAVPANADAVLREWSSRLATHCATAHAELLTLAPWMRAAQEHVIDSSLTRIPTLRELAEFTPAFSTATDLAPTERQRQLVLAQLVAEGSATARVRIARLVELAEQARVDAQMEMGFLYVEDMKQLCAHNNPGRLAQLRRRRPLDV